MPELTPDQIAARAKGIGGSDCAAAIGVHPSITPFDVYRHKVLGDPWPMTAPPFTLWLGHQMEPVVAAAFERETGMDLEEDDTHFQHPEHTFMLGNIDRAVRGRRQGVELKAWSEHAKPLWGESGTDDVPISVLCQSIHYLIVTGYECWHVGVLLGTEFRHYRIEPSEKLVNMVIERERLFWSCVETRTPPPPINLADLNRMYQTERPGSFIVADDEAIVRHTELYEAKQQLKKWEKIVEHHEFLMKQELKTNSCLVHPDDPEKKLVTWQSHDKRVADTEAMKRDGIYDAYSTEITARPLLVKPPK